MATQPTNTLPSSFLPRASIRYIRYIRYILYTASLPNFLLYDIFANFVVSFTTSAKNLS